MKTKITKEGWHIIQSDSHVGKWIEETGKLDHDEFLIPIACENMREGWTVLDCGALYGDHAIAYARVVGKNGAVICVEANKLAYECLTENASKFESTIVCVHAALCETHGGTAIHTMEKENIGASKVSSKKTRNPLEEPVRTISIDGLVQDARLDALNFIKIDCEGWEFKILKGAANTLKRFKPILMIEINNGCLAMQDACPKDIYDYLLDMNYSWRIIQPDLNGSAPQYDIMCWPNVIERLKVVTTLG